MSQPENESTAYRKKIWIAAGIVTLCLIIIFLFGILFRPLMLVLAGVLLAVYFIGCAGLIQKLNLPYKASLVSSIVLNIGLLVAFFWFAGSQLEQQVSELSKTLPQTIENAKDRMSQSTIGKKAIDLFQFSGDSSKSRAIVKRFFSSTFGALSDVYIIFLLSLFFIASPSIYKKGLIHLIPPQGKAKGKEFLDTLHKKMKHWIFGKIVAFLFIAIFTGIALWIIGMPLVLTLALIAGILNFIPNFGPLIALVPAVLIAMMQGANTVWWVLILYTVVQIVQSAVTTPLIQQKMVQLPPALVLFGQVALGLLAGFWGILLAAPVIIIIMTAVNKLYVERQANP